MLLFALATLAIVIAANIVVLVIGSFWLSDGLVSDPFSFDYWWKAHPQALLWTTLCTLALVAGASVYRMAALASGGGAVALSLGGTLVDSATRDTRRRQLVNVVEEMAIAAGVPVPQIYVLENETGINAFAAGFNVSDAAIAVSRGALTHLTRDELQGVIGHEFSHILNGDMRLNTRLMGVLFGILAIGLAGKTILRGISRVRISSNRGGGGAAMVGIAAVALALTIIGYLGVFFGRMIQAAVSRSRETLADASAVQFTRNPTGLSGALKKIAVFSGVLNAPKAEEVSHMLLADHHAAGLSSLFATHPPILERIRAIEPYFSESELKRVKLNPLPKPVLETPPAATTVADIALSPETIVATIGQLDSSALTAATTRRAQLPAALVEIAHDQTGVLELTLALSLSHVPAERVRQLATIGSAPDFGAEAATRITALAQQLAQLDQQYRLPLFEIAFPALRRRTPAELRALASLIDQLAQTDAHVDVFEYALARLLRLQLYEVLAPKARRAPFAPPKLFGLRYELQTLLSVLARVGHAGEREARAAYEQGIRQLVPMQTPAYQPTSDWKALDQALVRLDMVNPSVKQELIQGLVLTVSHDRRLTLNEAELLRVICASLHCPLPPFLPTAVDEASLTST